MKEKKRTFRKLLWLVSRLFPRLADCVYETMYFIQRGIYGWSERDCWSLDSYFDEKIPEMLRWLKETKHGVPNEFVDQAVKERGGTPGWEYGVSHTGADIDRGVVLYDAMLDKIIEGFNAHRKLDEHDWDYSDREKCKKIEDAYRATFEEGMRLFVKYYDTLWD